MGVITMKMISSTSITSTIGVTLISLTTGGAFFFSITDSSNSSIGLEPQRHAAARPARATGLFQLAQTDLSRRDYLPAPACCDRFRK